MVSVVWLGMIVPRITARQKILGQRLLSNYEGVVLGGAFRGMRYLPASYGSVLPAKLLGIYEQDLQSWISRVVEEPFDMIVDIGCAEGYYAVGFAVKKQRLVVNAFDISPEARTLCARLADINGVSDRVRIHGACDADLLQAALEKSEFPLVFSDCEGAELDILDQNKCPALLKADMLVEFHDMIRAGLTDELCRRFSTTHEIEIVSDSSWRRRSIMPEAVRKWNWLDRRIAAAELRGRGQQWGYFRAKRSRSL